MLSMVLLVLRPLWDHGVYPDVGRSLFVEIFSRLGRGWSLVALNLLIIPVLSVSF